MHSDDENRAPMSFEQLQTALRAAAAPAGAAESHGTLCGAICTGVEYDSAWLAHLLGEPPGNAPDPDSRNLLHALETRTRRQLAAFDMEFAPLLPADDEPLPQRVDALGHWCQGFLFGLSLGRSREVLEALGGEPGEVLHDVKEIARAGLEPSGADEADDQAYVELAEYLRVAVQILYEELNQAGPSSPGPGEPVTLH